MTNTAITTMTREPSIKPFALAFILVTPNG